MELVLNNLDSNKDKSVLLDAIKTQVYMIY